MSSATVVAARSALLAATLLFNSGASAAKPALELQIRNDAELSPARIEALRSQFQEWGARVYRYLQMQPNKPVKLRFSRRAGPGFYVGDEILLAPDDDEMLETWIHELTHQATGHDSSYFFKEGLATHVVEALFRGEHRVPQGWPQYGKSNDAWVNLFLARQQLIPLREALNWPRYDGRTREGDYRSWQVYCIAGSFVGWYIGRYGIDAFKQVFREEQPPQPIAELESAWLDAIRAQKLPLFDPATALPDRGRYRAFVRLLNGGKL